jgi:hypothetical protein
MPLPPQGGHDRTLTFVVTNQIELANKRVVDLEEKAGVRSPDQLDEMEYGLRHAPYPSTFLIKHCAQSIEPPLPK